MTELLGRRYAAPFGIAPMGASALSAYRGDLVFARAAAAAGLAEHPERLVADPPGGRAGGRPDHLVPGLSAGRPVAHRAAGGPGGGGGLRHLRADRRRAGLGQPGEQRPQRLQPAAAATPRLAWEGDVPPALAVRHGAAHVVQPRHAAFREHGRLPRTAGALGQPGARLRAARRPRLGASGADPEPLARAPRRQGDHRRRRMRGSRGKAASMASSCPTMAAGSSTAPCRRCGCCRRSRRKRGAWR